MFKILCYASFDKKKHRHKLAQVIGLVHEIVDSDLKTSTTFVTNVKLEQAAGEAIMNVVIEEFWDPMLMFGRTETRFIKIFLISACLRGKMGLWQPVSSVGRVPDFCAGGGGFKPRPDHHSGSLNN